VIAGLAEIGQKFVLKKKKKKGEKILLRRLVSAPPETPPGPPGVTTLNETLPTSSSLLHAVIGKKTKTHQIKNIAFKSRTTWKKTMWNPHPKIRRRKVKYYKNLTYSRKGHLNVYLRRHFDDIGISRLESSTNHKP
jgi:hypothetical protein